MTLNDGARSASKIGASAERAAPKCAVLRVVWGHRVAIQEIGLAPSKVCGLSMGFSTARREGVEYQCERWEELLVHGMTQIKANALQDSMKSVSRQIYRACTSISLPKSLFRMLLRGLYICCRGVT